MKYNKDKIWLIVSVFIHLITIFFGMKNSDIYGFILLYVAIISWILSGIAVILGIKRIIQKEISGMFITALILFFIYFIAPILIFAFAIIFGLSV